MPVEASQRPALLQLFKHSSGIMKSSSLTYSNSHLYPSHTYIKSLINLSKNEKFTLNEDAALRPMTSGC